jgi:hypothetical protein
MQSQVKSFNWICNNNCNIVDEKGLDYLHSPCAISSIPQSIPINDRKIILIQQFFIHSDPSRNKEILETLKMNVHNENIHEIHLINEKVYTAEQLGSNNEKIKQIVISGDRLTYKEAIIYSMDNLQNAVVVLANSDIFFDKSIMQCKNLDLQDSMICLSRYKLRGHNLNNAILDAYNGWSQDSWIWLSDTSFNYEELDKTNFNLGKPGCDNRIAFLASQMGLSIYNITNIIKSYHHHATEIRNYTASDRVRPERYMSIVPPRNCSSLTTFLPANDAHYLANYFDKHSDLSIVNARSEDMVLLRRGFLSLNDPNLTINLNDVKQFIFNSTFVFVDIPYTLPYYHPCTNARVEFSVNTQWLNLKDRFLDYRCMDYCIAKRRNFLQYSDKSIIVATNRCNLLRTRIQNDCCTFTNAVQIIDIDVKNVTQSIHHISSSYDSNKIVLLDTGADLIFGTLLFKSNIPSIAIGPSINSYFNILDKSHASTMIDAYQIEANHTWLTI